jgi:hypothetical protein
MCPTGVAYSSAGQKSVESMAIDRASITVDECRVICYGVPLYKAMVANEYHVVSKVK